MPSYPSTTIGGTSQIVQATVPTAIDTATIVEGSLIPALTTVPEALVGVVTLVAAVTLFARRGGRTDNTSNVWWGFTSANSSQQKKLLPGDAVLIQAPPGKFLDLSTIYVDTETATDGVQWVSMV